MQKLAEKDLRFPVYIVSEKPIKIGMVLKNKKGLIYDNKILSGNSIGLRRLKIPKEKRAKLNTAAHTITDLVRKGRNKWLIDSNGLLTKYTPTKFYPTRYIKILTYYKVEEEGIYLILEGIKDPYFYGSTNKRIGEYNYICFIDFGHILIFYRLDKSYNKQTRIKV